MTAKRVVRKEFEEQCRSMLKQYIDDMDIRFINYEFGIDNCKRRRREITVTITGYLLPTYLRTKI